MDSTLRLGLGTINIMPLMEGLVYYKSTCSEFRYGDGKALCTQLHPTRRLASTHCVPNPNPIKGSSNMLF